ncbi:hypothetical protein ACFXBB_01695 [Streptomyces scopuliridis]|uniref:hypothetical protein n=1 Tax=Streptomyces scopuliridis TaxID=452529 RepID=UPI0036B5F7C2
MTTTPTSSARTSLTDRNGNTAWTYGYTAYGSDDTSEFTGNRYAFTSGNPVSFVETDGHFFPLILVAIPVVDITAVAVVATVPTDEKGRAQGATALLCPLGEVHRQGQLRGRGRHPQEHHDDLWEMEETEGYAPYPEPGGLLCWGASRADSPR